MNNIDDNYLPSVLSSIKLSPLNNMNIENMNNNIKNLILLDKIAPIPPKESSKNLNCNKQNVLAGLLENIKAKIDNIDNIIKINKIAEFNFFLNAMNKNGIIKQNCSSTPKLHVCIKGLNSFTIDQ